MQTDLQQIESDEKEKRSCLLEVYCQGGVVSIWTVSAVAVLGMFASYLLSKWANKATDT